MSPLRREDYAEPKIIAAIGQVLIDWSPEQVRAFDDSIREESSELFIDRKTADMTRFTINFGPEQSISHETEAANSIIQYVFEKPGNLLILEPSGFRVALSSPPYPGRELLLKWTAWATDKIAGFLPSATASRASVLYKSHIEPPEDPFRIEDYIVPKFELDDPALDMFAFFEHKVTLDLQALRMGPRFARLVIGNEAGHKGIFLTVDVIDDRKSPLAEASDRLVNAKNVQTHIFECLITDNTRKLYGIR